MNQDGTLRSSPGLKHDRDRAYPAQATRVLRGASQVLISNRRDDMPFGEPFG
jgi:hypothetical protein